MDENVFINLLPYLMFYAILYDIISLLLNRLFQTEDSFLHTSFCSSQKDNEFKNERKGADVS